MATIQADKALTAFLDLIAWSEGTSKHPLTKLDGYDVIVSGVDGHHVFADYSIHPFALGREPIVVRQAKAAVWAYADTDEGTPNKLVHAATPELLSTASGRYQIILPTWREVSTKALVGTFSPQSQDRAALYLLTACGADKAILAGCLPLAFQLVTNIWASFPGNLFHQGGHSTDELIAQYNQLHPKGIMS